MLSVVAVSLVAVPFLFSAMVVSVAVVVVTVVMTVMVDVVVRVPVVVVVIRAVVVIVVVFVMPVMLVVAVMTGMVAVVVVVEILWFGRDTKVAAWYGLGMGNTNCKVNKPSQLGVHSKQLLLSTYAEA